MLRSMNHSFVKVNHSVGHLGRTGEWPLSRILQYYDRVSILDSMKTESSGLGNGAAPPEVYCQTQTNDHTLYLSDKLLFSASSVCTRCQHVNWGGDPI